MQFVAIVIGIWASSILPAPPRAPDETAHGHWSSVRGPENVMPTGWRRTAHGWELAENWSRPAASPAEAINALIRSQQDHESRQWWLRGLSAAMRCVRSLDPVTLVATQITMIALLVALARCGRADCPPTDGTPTQ